MQSRQLRRAAERKARKQVRKNQTTPVTPEAPSRAEINRENSQHSTGPRTPEGHAVSSRNSFKHGLYSKALIYPGENAAELDALKADLRAEHQPANTTEEILVNELAEQFWRIRRWRSYDARFLNCETTDGGLAALTKFLPVIQRLMSAAERGFHKALSALRQLQKDRGFVPHISANTAEEKTETVAYAEVGFVPQPDSPQKPEPRKYSARLEARWAESVKYGDVEADEYEVKDLLAADFVHMYGRRRLIPAGFVPTK